MEKCLDSTEDKNDSLLRKKKKHSIIHVTITLENKSAYFI